MKPYVEALDRHVMALMEETRRAKRKTGASTPSVLGVIARLTQRLRLDMVAASSLSVHRFLPCFPVQPVFLAPMYSSTVLVSFVLRFARLPRTPSRDPGARVTLQKILVMEDPNDPATFGPVVGSRSDSG